MGFGKDVKRLETNQPVVFFFWGGANASKANVKRTAIHKLSCGQDLTGKLQLLEEDAAEQQQKIESLEARALSKRF